MTVRVVRTEDPLAQAQAPALRLIAPAEPVIAKAEPEPAPAPAPQVTPAPAMEGPVGPSMWEAAAIQAVAINTALAEILSIRFGLILTIGASAALTAFAEAQHEHQVLAVVAAALFSIPSLTLMVALALRKG